MNENIKSMCLKLAELALETKDIYVSIMDYSITIHHFDFEGEGALYFENISFHYQDDTEERIEKALEYVRNLGGNKDV
ncbi:hypothetical protein [Clostridium sp.]|uniref:hypothetical protein n=1 Tax=Clostridium sp. TaxID=1506 RepID=UPI003217A352